MMVPVIIEGYRVMIQQSIRGLVLLAIVPYALLHTTLNAQTISLDLPIDGAVGRDYFIVNHVDHDTTEGIRDYECGTKTYDGHQGTDFTLRSFAQMDSGVSVKAAADGIIRQVVDTLFDRNKESVIERGFGNWIEIEHSGGWFTYYAHLRTGSATMSAGDSVRAGETIGLVGSSGNSSDPHLHFEVWRVLPQLHDPFGDGACSESPSLWKKQPVYRDGYGIIDVGLLDFVPTLDALRERPAESEEFAGPDSAVAFWVHQEGLREGDVLRVIWERTSDGLVWFEYETPVYDRDWWYHYFWTWIDLPADDEYRVRYLRNGQEIFRRTFDVGATSAIVETGDVPSPLVIRYLPGDWGILAISSATGEPVEKVTVRIFTMSGEEVAGIDYDQGPATRHLLDLQGMGLPSGLYMFRISSGGYAFGAPVHLRAW